MDFEHRSQSAGKGKVMWNDEHAELRQKNWATVEKYMNTTGQDRLKRHLLFTDDGVGGLWTNDTGKPIVINGKDRLAAHAVWSLECFPDWVWTNIQIFETQDRTSSGWSATGSGPSDSRLPGRTIRESLPSLLRARRRPDQAAARVHEPLRATARARHPGAAGQTRGHPDLSGARTMAGIQRRGSRSGTIPRGFAG